MLVGQYRHNRARRITSASRLGLLLFGISSIPVTAWSAEPANPTSIWAAIVAGEPGDGAGEVDGARFFENSPQRQSFNYTSPQSGAATKPAVTSATITPDIFESELDAVVHAMNQYNPLSVEEDREYIGAIYELSNGTYIYSVAPGTVGSDEVSAGIPRIKMARFVAFWHTHGADHWSRRFFSDIDTDLVRHWRLPFYMGSADGRLRVFRPEHKVMSSKQAQRIGLVSGSGYALGEIVGDVAIAVR